MFTRDDEIDPFQNPEGQDRARSRNNQRRERRLANVRPCQLILTVTSTPAFQE